VKTNQSFDANVEFLVVSPDAQGMGVGKKLWFDLKETFVGQGIKDIYVYTDTSCNFGFYDHQGFTKIGTNPLKTQHHEVDVYLYSIKLSPLNAK
jgi:N-acetylglutamate synthase-like GNAT family acetyltransferase